MDTPILQTWSLRRRAALLALLIAAGLAGNYFKYPILLDIDFLFGSIFAMLALQFFGPARGALAAGLIAGVTYVLWNHPYAIIIMTLEVAAVAWMVRRAHIGLVLADALYWLIVGMPLVYLFYHVVMDVALGNAAMAMTKQAVNGIANALLARLLFTALVLKTRTGQIAYRDLIYNLLAFFALCPALVLLMMASHSDNDATDSSIRSELLRNSALLGNRIDVWTHSRAEPIVNLAAQAGARSPAQMQVRLEQVLASDSNFLRIGLLDQDANTTAFTPLIDELGQSSIGRNFSSRPFIAQLKQTLKPMLSEVVMGRIGTPRPIVTMLAPVVREREYRGYITGILSLSEVQEFLEKSTQSATMLYTLLDKNGNVILTNRKGQQVMSPLKRGAGSLNALDQRISQWLPTLPPNTPVSERWKSSSYVVDTAVGELAAWRLVLEQPVAPFQKILYARYTQELALLLLMLFAALALAEYLSRKVASRTEQLSEFTKHLPIDLGLGAQPVWPESNLLEHHQLIEKFKQMTASLAAQFGANRQLTASLEQRVAQRTAALTLSEEKYRLLIENSHDIIYTLGPDGVLTFVSPAWETLLGHALSDVVFHPFMSFVHADDIAACMAAVQRLFQTGTRQTDIEYRVRHVDGSWRWHSSNASPIMDECGKVTGFEGTAKDITEQRTLEVQVRQLAFYDALTQLPNRRLLDDRLRQTMAASQRSDGYCALMFLDLDNFKALNDTQGHAVGDLFLVEVARRLLACVRASDTVARFGGDEFVVLLGALHEDRAESAAQARAVAEKMRSSLAQPYLLVEEIDGIAHKVAAQQGSVSIGVVMFVNHESESAELLMCADAAMYQAKDAGRNSIRFYEAPAVRP